MKIHVENLGRIKDATVELKPFTVFIGPNNTNKTWLSYVIYALGDGRLWQRYARSIVKRSRNNNLGSSFWKEVIEQFESKNQIDYEFILNNLDSLLNELCSHLTQKEIYDYIKVGDNSNAFKKLRLSISFSEDDIYKSLLSLKNKEIQIQDKPPYGIIIAKKVQGSLILDLKIESQYDKQSIFSTIIYDRILLYLKNRLFGFNNPFMLPSDRIGLTSFYKELYKIKITENPKIATEIKNNMPRIYLRYLDFLSKVEDFYGGSGKNELLTKLLEDYVLNGQVNFLEKDVGKDIYFTPTEGVNIPVKASSSMVRSVLGLSFYLKYSMSKFLVFDEPEMNLHPESIVKLTELLAVYVNQGNQLLMTTHSPYIVDHLNNLTEAGKSTKDPNDIEQLFWLKTKDAFLKPEQVAVYYFDPNGTVEDIYDRENNLIDWDTFSTVSNRVRNIINFL